MPTAPRFALIAALVVACGSSRDAPTRPDTTTLPDGIVAQVAGDDISAEWVREVARVQGIGLREARERVVSDAVFAAHARSALRGTGMIESAERSALARVMLESIAADAKRAGPPTDDEVEEVTARRWLDFARPALVRTTHAVVIDEEPRKSAKARRVAERILAAVAASTSPEDFEVKAKAVDAEGLTVKVEQLPPVAADGRIGDPKAAPGAEPGLLEKTYSAGAHAIEPVPGVSGLVESRYGIHVIFAVERIPAKQVPLEERRIVLEREIIDRRALERHQKILEATAKSVPVLLDRGVNDLLARVQVVR